MQAFVSEIKSRPVRIEGSGVVSAATFLKQSNGNPVFTSRVFNSEVRPVLERLGEKEGYLSRIPPLRIDKARFPLPTRRRYLQRSLATSIIILTISKSSPVIAIPWDIIPILVYSS